MSDRQTLTRSLSRVLVLVWLIAALPEIRATDPPQGIYGAYNESDAASQYVAPGSTVLIFSGDVPVGPEALQAATRFPLVTTLAGTSVKITVAGISSDAYVLGAETHWVRAMLPSGTPLGDGQLVVTYNGRSSVPYRLLVRERGFGVYNGSACSPSFTPAPPGFCVGRAVQNIDASGAVSTNSLLAPARPGQLVTLWGTGLGFAPGDEAAGPISGNLQVPGLRVLVGGQPANVVYSGRSGCCAGMDEIIFEVPPGIEGCNVPVWVRYAEDGSTSADVFVSIASGAGSCSDSYGLSESEVHKLSAGNLKTAEIWVSSATGYWSAAFGEASQTAALPLGSCGSLWGEGLPALPGPGAFSDAGATLNLHSQHGAYVAARTPEGAYNGSFDVIPEPGEYHLDNGAGAPGLGPFQAAFSFPDAAFLWTDRDTFGTGQHPFTVSWAVADPAAGHVEIYGNLALDGETTGSTVFTCGERAAKGSFTIPASVLERAGVWSGRFNEFHLRVTFRVSSRINIPGLDFAEFVLFGPLQATTIDPGSLPHAGRR